MHLAADECVFLSALAPTQLETLSALLIYSELAGCFHFTFRASKLYENVCAHIECTQAAQNFKPVYY